MTDDHYTCAKCGETFRKEISDTEANAEAESNFGVKDASHNPAMVIVCDDCFHELTS